MKVIFEVNTHSYDVQDLIEVLESVSGALAGHFALMKPEECTWESNKKYLGRIRHAFKNIFPEGR